MYVIMLRMCVHNLASMLSVRISIEAIHSKDTDEAILGGIYFSRIILYFEFDR